MRMMSIGKNRNGKKQNEVDKWRKEKDCRKDDPGKNENKEKRTVPEKKVLQKERIESTKGKSKWRRKMQKISKANKIDRQGRTREWTKENRKRLAKEILNILVPKIWNNFLRLTKWICHKCNKI